MAVDRQAELLTALESLCWHPEAASDARALRRCRFALEAAAELLAEAGLIVRADRPRPLRPKPANPRQAVWHGPPEKLPEIGSEIHWFALDCEALFKVPLLDGLQAWGAARGFPGRAGEWNREQVQIGLQELWLVLKRARDAGKLPATAAISYDHDWPWPMDDFVSGEQFRTEPPDAEPMQDDDDFNF